MRVTHLTLDETTRQLAAMRASMKKRTMSEHVAELIKADADAAGLSDFLAGADRSQTSTQENLSAPDNLED